MTDDVGAKGPLRDDGPENTLFLDYKGLLPRLEYVAIRGIVSLGPHSDSEVVVVIEGFLEKVLFFFFFY